MFKGRDESLDFIGLLEWKCRIYTLFTPLEDWIGIVRIGRREMNLTSFFGKNITAKCNNDGE